MSHKEAFHYHGSGILDEITAVALCGGDGIRLGAPIPKPLVKVSGKPLIDYTINPLRDAGVTNFLYLAAQNKADIERHIRDTAPSANSTVLDSSRTSGIAIEIRDALLEQDITGPIALLLTDDVREGFEFGSALQYHQETEAQLTLIGRSTKKLRPSSIIVHDENNSVLQLIRNKDRVAMPGSTASCGITICSSEATELIRTLPDDEIVSSGSLHPLKKYLMDRLTQVKVYVPTAKMAFVNINTQRDIHNAERLLSVYNRRQSSFFGT